LLGRETDPLKRRIGYAPQEIALYDDLSAALTPSLMLLGFAAASGAFARFRWEVE